MEFTTVTAIVAFILSTIGFIATIGIIFGMPTGIILIIIAATKDSKKKKTKYRRIGLWLLIIPPVLTIAVLISYAILNSIMQATI